MLGLYKRLHLVCHEAILWYRKLNVPENVFNDQNDRLKRLKKCDVTKCFIFRLQKSIERV